MPISLPIGGRHAAVRLAIGLVLPTSVLACAPGELREGLAPDDNAPASVSVSADRDSVFTGEVVLVRAGARTASGQPTTAEVDWSSDGGTVVPLTDSTAQFSAPAAGRYRIRGRGRRNQNLQDSTSITVTQPVSPIVSIGVSPKPATLTPGGIVAFVATATRQDGTTLTANVTWTATGGTITQAGVYTAGSSPGGYRVIATQQGGSLADTSAVTITAQPPVLQAVILTPPTATVVAGATRQFSVSGQWSDGSSSAPAVTFAATGGSISASGLYTAGTTAGTFRVIATQQGGTLADTSVVTVTPAPAVLQAVILSPSSAAIFTGAFQQFAVSGQWSDGSTAVPAVSYSATGGTITPGGLYTAGSTAGTYRVVATQIGGSLADTAVVTVTAPVLQAVILTPSSVSLQTGATRQFSVSGQWNNGATTAPAVTYTATGGTITSTGLFTAGSTTGTYRVIATEQGGSLADSSTVTISSAPTGGVCANRPASYTNILPEFDFSASIPAGGGNERQVAGTAWSVIYDGNGSGGSNFSRVSDPTAPRSPSQVWQLRQPAGDYGTLGQGGGHGFGNVFRSLPNGTRQLYACWYSKFSVGYYVHPVSHKYVNIFTSTGDAVYVQLARYGNYWEALDGATDYPFPTLINQAPIWGTWIQQEIQVVAGNPGIVRVWIDGQLRTEATNHAVAAGATLDEFGLFGHMGGGGFDLSADQYQWFDNILIATP